MAKIKDWAGYLAFKMFKVFLLFLPRSLCLILGKTLGASVYYLDKRHRHVALSNLKKAFGTELNLSQRKKITKAAFHHFGKSFLDILKFRYLPQSQIQGYLMVEGEEHVRKALRKGNGVLFFSAHFGNWEVASAFLSSLGPLNVIARPLDNPLLEKELLRIRIHLGARVIYKKQSARQILRALHTNEMVAILIDQNVVKNQAVFVDFFGKSAATTPSLATFFLKTKAPVIPVFCYPSSRKNYHLKIFKPLSLSASGKEQEDVLKITQLCTKIIQSRIQQHPDYWFWFHNRWKTRPGQEEKYLNREKK